MDKYLSIMGERKRIKSRVKLVRTHDLNDILMKFYAELRKADGSEYEPACLRVMKASLDRYLKEKKYPVSLLDMEEFKESNLILEGKARDLRDRCMGNRPN